MKISEITNIFESKKTENDGMEIMSPYEFLEKSNKDEVDEAIKLPAPHRPFGDDELTDYLDRIRSRSKKKTDKYKLPYIHRSSVISYYSEEGNKYNTESIKRELKVRPKKILKKNEKMEHSDGEYEQFFNVGFAALTGIALDEESNELIIVNTCPGAGSCKVQCFAMGGGKIQFKGPWLSDGRLLTYLLNDPDGFFNQVKSEIERQVKRGLKNEYKVSIRWHDAGDFFSPEYVDLAFKLARELPQVDFYAYTKMGDVAIKDKPSNFIINWSEGAHPTQEKKVKASDTSLSKTKNSRIVQNELFYDLLVKDEDKKLIKGPKGEWQIMPDKINELKDRLSKEYGLSKYSILTYKEYDDKKQKLWKDWLSKQTNTGQTFAEMKKQYNDEMSKKMHLKWNVIIAPGEPDITAKSHDVLSTLLLRH
jgi:hypothetical protein